MSRTAAEDNFVDRISRGPSDLAEVVCDITLANLKYEPHEDLITALREVGFVAWGVAYGEEEPAVLAAVAADALRVLDRYANFGVERTVLRAVIAEAEHQAAMACVPDDAVVTGSGCLAAHVADAARALDGTEGGEI